MYLTRRLLRRKPIALGLFCCAVIYFGYGIGSGLHSTGQQPHSHRLKRNDQPGTFQMLWNSIMFGGAAMQDGSFEAVLLKRHETGNYEPTSELHGNGPGENGQPATYADWENKTVVRSINEYSFNQYISDKIPLDRSIPDLRSTQCRQWYYPDWLPQASVVIIFHNEGWSTLIRTVTSVVKRTPPHLLKEIVLVDDFSTKVHLHKQLDEYISTKFPNLGRIIRNSRRLGVIGSRMAGTEQATAPVLVFLDAHCEVGINWLPPLLTVVARNSSSVAVPILDVVDSMTFAISPQTGNKISRGAFDWSLDFKIIPGLPEREFRQRQYATQPYRSPVMSGGVFAINRAYFLDMGGHDQGLQMWGGENFELSFKVWMCGGSVIWVPCSRVAHLYRINGIPPYTFPDGTFGYYRDRNYARVASIWMDGFRDYLYISKPNLQADNIDIGDIAPQLIFRQEKQCKSFNWYMQEIAYDLKDHFPLPPLSVVYGEVRGVSGEVCLDTKGKEPAKHGSSLGLFKCHGLGGNQFFRLTTDGDIRVNGYCLGQQGANGVILVDCRDEQTVKTWVYDEDRKRIERRDVHKCLQRVGQEVQLQTCIRNMPLQALLQLWTFENPFRDTYAKRQPVGRVDVAYGV